MVWGCISAHGMGDLHICDGTIDAEAYVRIWETCCRQDEELHVYFSRTMPGLILQELQQRGFIGIEWVSLTGLPAVQICLILKIASYWKSHHEEENQTTVTTDCWAAQVLYTPRMGKNFTCKTATTDIFRSQTITKWQKHWKSFVCPFVW